MKSKLTAFIALVAFAVSAAAICIASAAYAKSTIEDFFPNGPEDYGFDEEELAEAEEALA